VLNCLAFRFLDFHKFYFDTASDVAKQAHRNTTLCDVNVRFVGEVCAVVSYVRLNQKLDAAGNAVTTSYNETRVFEKSANGWQQVHLHRST
jgi:ketosteroid isomerase-like protein